jgi:hypothetical protein
MNPVSHSSDLPTQIDRVQTSDKAPGEVIMHYNIYTSGYWAKLAAARPKLGGSKDWSKDGGQDGADS